MAAVLSSVAQAGKRLFKFNYYGTLLHEFVLSKNIRYLYTEQYLGMDKYMELRKRTATQFQGLKEKFCNRMRDYVSQEGQSNVYTEDLKNMIFLAEDNPDDIEVCIRMILKINSRNKAQGFGTFVFGPITMRWMYFLKKPDLVMQMIRNEELSGFFDQVPSYHVAMDLLFNEARYEDVLVLFQILQERNIHGQKFHKEPLVLALGACYKINTPESYEKAMEIIKGARECGASIVRRGLTFSAALALKQKQPKMALEIISLSTNSHYITIRNLRLLALADMNRLEDIFPILRMIIDRDLPKSSPKLGFMCQETIEYIQKKIQEANDKESSHIFEQICRALTENRHITTETLDDLLASPVGLKQSFRGDRDWSDQPGSTSRPFRSLNSYRGDNYRGERYPRGGLKDIED